MQAYKALSLHHFSAWAKSVWSPMGGLEQMEWSKYIWKVKSVLENVANNKDAKADEITGQLRILQNDAVLCMPCVVVS